MANGGSAKPFAIEAEDAIHYADTQATMMKRTIGIVCLLGVAGGVAMILSCAPMRSTPGKQRGAAGGEEGYLSPVAVIADRTGERLYVAERTGRQVAVIDLATGTVRRKLPLPAEASGLAMSRDGKRLLVTAGLGDGKLVIFDAASGRRTGLLDAGHSPMAPVVGRDGTIYVCDRFRNAVLAFARDSTKPVSIGVSRQPVGLGIGDGGRRLVVINHLPAGAADGYFTAAVVTLIDTAANKVVKEIPLPNGGTNLRGVAISPDGRRACVTHILARFRTPAVQLEGWMNTNAMTIIDVPGGKIVNTVLLDDYDNGAAGAWGAAWTADGKYICVGHAGTHEISVIDWAGLAGKLAASAADDEGDHVRTDLFFLSGLRRRIKLEGNSPRGLTIVGSRIYAAMYFSDSICTLDVKAGVRPAPATIRLGPERPLTRARKGEIYFNDAARMCFHQWQSCASCHPDGRNDGLNWDLVNDGMGNPKSTKSMVLAPKTPPAMVTGIRADSLTAIEAGFRSLQLAVCSAEEAACVNEYLKNLRPAPSPHLVRRADGSLGLSESAGRGKVLFQTARCASCHKGPYLTDMKTRDVGTGVYREDGRKFDTPTLREVWRTGPYLYDGRAATMREVFEKFNPNDKHGTTSKLNARQIADLCQYVLSL